MAKIAETIDRISAQKYRDLKVISSLISFWEMRMEVHKNIHAIMTARKSQISGSLKILLVNPRGYFELDRLMRARLTVGDMARIAP